MFVCVCESVPRNVSCSHTQKYTRQGRMWYRSLSKKSPYFVWLFCKKDLYVTTQKYTRQDVYTSLIRLISVIWCHRWSVAEIANEPSWVMLRSSVFNFKKSESKYKFKYTPQYVYVLLYRTLSPSFFFSLYFSHKTLVFTVNFRKIQTDKTQTKHKRLCSETKCASTLGFPPIPSEFNLSFSFFVFEWISQ